MTNEFLKDEGIIAQVFEFEHPDDMIVACEKEPFHIFLLDMVMPMLNGLDAGRSIRRISTDAQIIFITAEPGYALDAYSVYPLHYLLKPVDKAQLYSALRLAVSKINQTSEKSVTVKTRLGLQTLPLDTILCCEYCNHRVCYLTLNGEIETVTMTENFAEHIAPLLKDRRFIAPHAAYTVNMSFVERLDKSGFYLRGGKFVPVSGRHYADVRNRYLSYRLEG